MSAKPSVPKTSRKVRRARRAGTSRHKPVYVRVGAVVRKDGSIELLLDERVTALTIAGPFPKLDPPDLPF